MTLTLTAIGVIVYVSKCLDKVCIGLIFSKSTSCDGSKDCV